MSDGERVCRTCPARLSPLFVRRLYCDPCRASGRRDRDVSIRARYGAFGLLAFEAMLAAQDGRCANPLCDNPPEYVHHRHSCCPGRHATCGACVEWIMCPSCNVAEGHLKTARRARGLALLMDRGL